MHLPANKLFANYGFPTLFLKSFLHLSQNDSIKPHACLKPRSYQFWFVYQNKPRVCLVVGDRETTRWFSEHPVHDQPVHHRIKYDNGANYLQSVFWT